MRDKVLGPSTAVNSQKAEDLVKHPAGSAAKLLAGRAGYTGVGQTGLKQTQGQASQSRYPVSAVPAANRVPDKKIPVRHYEPDTLFTPLRGMNGFNNESLSPRELEELRNRVERDYENMREQRRMPQIGYTDMGRDSNESEFI